MRQLALVMVAACGAPHHATPDAAPVQLDLDVVVDHDGVFVYPNGSDRDGASCPGAHFYFPKTEQLIYYDDVFSCTPDNMSCLTSIRLDVGAATYVTPTRPRRC